jgi:hypothetical protein
MCGRLLVTEDSCIPLTPYFPSYEKNKRGHSLAVGKVPGRHLDPPLFYCKTGPKVDVDANYPKPTHGEVPYPIGESTVHKKVINRFNALLAKGAKSTIRPTSLGQPVGRPNSILCDEPSKELGFRWSPSFPNRGIDRGLDQTQELHLICGFGGVLAIGGKSPSDIVIYKLIELNGGQERPKIK